MLASSNLYQLSLVHAKAELHLGTACSCMGINWPHNIAGLCSISMGSISLFSYTVQKYCNACGVLCLGGDFSTASSIWPHNIAGLCSISMGSILLFSYTVQKYCNTCGVLCLGRNSGTASSICKHAVKCRAAKLAESEEGVSVHGTDHEKVSFASKSARACLHVANLGLCESTELLTAASPYFPGCANFSVAGSSAICCILQLQTALLRSACGQIADLHNMAVAMLSLCCLACRHCLEFHCVVGLRQPALVQRILSCAFVLLPSILHLTNCCPCSKFHSYL